MSPGERLRQWRKEKNFTSKYVAEKIGVSDPTISQFEIGKSQLKANNLLKLSEVFGISIDWLLTGNNHKYVNGIISTEQQELINIYNKLDKIHQEMLFETAKGYFLSLQEQKQELSNSRKVS